MLGAALGCVDRPFGRAERRESRFLGSVSGLGAVFFLSPLALGARFTLHEIASAGPHGPSRRAPPASGGRPEGEGRRGRGWGRPREGGPARWEMRGIPWPRSYADEGTLLCVRSWVGGGGGRRGSAGGRNVPGY